MIDLVVRKKERGEDENPKRIVLAPNAILQIYTLVLHSSLEVGFYGTAYRENKQTYKIEDIRVYPQIVTPAHIEPDWDKYTSWDNALNDNWYVNRRFHGHSHVSMATGYSATDYNNQTEIMKAMRPGDFYIFAVFNKHGQVNASVVECVDETDDHLIFERYDGVKVTMEGSGAVALDEFHKNVTAAYMETKWHTPWPFEKYEEDELDIEPEEDEENGSVEKS